MKTESDHEKLQPGGSFDHTGKRLSSLACSELVAVMRIRIEEVLKRCGDGKDVYWTDACGVVDVLNAMIRKTEMSSELRGLEFRGFQQFELACAEAAKAAL